MATTDELTALEQSHAEAAAWETVVAELKHLLPAGADINFEKYDPVVRAIQLWGEKLYQVRRRCTPTAIDNAYAEAHAAYQRAYRRRQERGGK